MFIKSVFSQQSTAEGTTRKTVTVAFGGRMSLVVLKSSGSGGGGGGGGGPVPVDKHAWRHAKKGPDAVTPKSIGAHLEGGSDDLDFRAGELSAKNTATDNLLALQADIQQADIQQAYIKKVIAPEIVSPEYIGGALGQGFRYYIDENGNSVMVLDKLRVMKEATFNVLTISELRSVGGQVLFTYADAKLTAAVEKQSVWRCYYDSADGGQYFLAGDQVRCQRFKGTSGDTLKYYWRLVTAVGSEELGGKIYQWFELSKGVADGSGIPEVGDQVVGLGHRGEDRRRKNAKLISAFGEKGVEEISYANIDGFSLVGKETAYQSPERWRIASQRFELVAGDGIVYPIVVERGAWSDAQAPYYYYDRVSHGGNIYLCIDKRLDGTTVEPAADQHAVWLCEVRKGDDGAKGDKGEQGAAAPRLKTQFSTDGTTDWHDAYAVVDAYRRESNDNGVTWSVAMKMVGEKGAAGANGKKTPYTDFAYAYGLSQPATWLDAPPSKVEGQHLWERIQKYTPKADNSGWALASTSYAIISENIEIGGRNYLLNSNFSIKDTATYRVSSPDDIYANIYSLDWVGGKLVVKGSAPADGGQNKRVLLFTQGVLPAGDYVLSMDISANISANIYARFFWGKMQVISGGSCSIGASTKRVSLLLRNEVSTVPSTYNSSVAAIWFDQIGTFTIDNIKLEKGNKATDWSAAPEDTEVTAEKIITEINMSDDTLLLKAEKIELIGKSISAGKMQINPKTGDVIMNDVTMNNANVSGKVTASSGSIANMLAVSNNQLRSGKGMLNISEGKADATKPGLTRCDNIAEGYISRSISVTAGAGAEAFAPVVLNNQTAGRFEFSVAVMLTSSYSGTVSIGMRLNGGNVLTFASDLVTGGASSSRFVTVEYMLPKVDSEITFVLQCTKQYRGYAHLYLRKEPTMASPVGIYYDNRDKNIFQEFGVMHKYGNGQLYLTSLSKDPKLVDESGAEAGMVVGGHGFIVRPSGISMIVDNQERCLSNVDVLYASTSVSVTDKYNVVICNNGSGITVTLPANPTMGRIIYVHQVVAGNTVTINGNGKGIDATSSGRPTYNIQAREGVTVALIYDGVKWFGFKMSNIR